MNKSHWISCPDCGKSHFLKLFEDTVLINYPAYCKGCKRQIMVSAKAGRVRLLPDRT